MTAAAAWEAAADHLPTEISNPGGQIKVLQSWPGQTPPVKLTGRTDDYATAAFLARRSAASLRRQLRPSNLSK